jgi:hypothetical protein
VTDSKGSNQFEYDMSPFHRILYVTTYLVLGSSSTAALGWNDAISLPRGLSLRPSDKYFGLN